MNDALRQSCWSALLDADYNARYWRAMALLLVREERFGKIVAAISSSAVVASWFLWIQAEGLWKILSVLTAIMSIALPIIDIPRKIEQITEVHGGWLALMNDYEQLWATVDDGADIATAMQPLKQREVELSKKSITLPSDNDELQKASFREVLRARRITE